MADVGLVLSGCGAPIPARAGVVIDCALVRKHREKDPRAYFHVGHKGDFIICAALEAGYLPDEHLYALVLHEFGHPLAWKAWGKSEQEHADWIGHGLLGIPILYKSSLTLQWITPKDVKRLKLPPRFHKGRISVPK